MKRKKRYWVESFFKKEIVNSSDYHSYKYQIDANGSINVNTANHSAKIYTPEMAILLISDELEIEDLSTKEIIRADELGLLNTYIESFKEGEEYFEKDFKTTPDVLYGMHAEQYVQDIHFNYYHKELEFSHEGWVFVKRRVPFLFQIDTIKEYGFYAGLISRVDQQIEKYSQIFNKYDHCDFNQSNDKLNNAMEPSDLSNIIETHFSFYAGNCPRKHKKILSDKDHSKLIKWVIEYFEKDLTVPVISEPIEVVNTNKTYVQLSFKYLFKQIHKNSTYPSSLFDLYRYAFTPYSEDKRSNFESVKNNDEVKDLMKIPY